ARSVRIVGPGLTEQRVHRELVRLALQAQRRRVLTLGARLHEPGVRAWLVAVETAVGRTAPKRLRRRRAASGCRNILRPAMRNAGTVNDRLVVLEPRGEDAAVPVGECGSRPQRYVDHRSGESASEED